MNLAHLVNYYGLCSSFGLEKSSFMSDLHFTAYFKRIRSFYLLLLSPVPCAFVSYVSLCFCHIHYLQYVLLSGLYLFIAVRYCSSVPL